MSGITYFEFSKKFKKTIKKLKKRLFFNDILFIGIEAYIDILISSILNLRVPLVSKGGEVIGLLLSYFTTIFTFILMPAGFLYIFKQSLEKLKEEKFQTKWGALYEQVSIKSKVNVMFYGLYMARRVIFVILAFSQDGNTLQILGILFINKGMLIYQGYFRPLKSRENNMIEITNEVWITLSTMHIVTFTDFVSNKDS